MSEATDEANAFVRAHHAQATALGEELAGLIGEPEVFVRALERGLSRLVDPAYTQGVLRVSAGVSAELTVRSPLNDAVQRSLGHALQEASSIYALSLAQRLVADDRRAVRLYALPALRRALPEDPEQAWQLMRQMGRRAEDWIEVDSLADLWARGILAEPFRWAELEQLVYSRHTFERRLVGAALATVPHRVPGARREALRARASSQALRLIGKLMGDAEVMVQKSLSWALREWARVDREAVAAFLRDEAAVAVEHGDGARAWVIRDALVGQAPADAAALREQLAGIQRDRNAPSTSIAASEAAAFAGALDDADDAVAAQGHRYTRSHA